MVSQTTPLKSFVTSEEGSDYLRDAIIYELHRSLDAPSVSTAAAELLIQTLVSSWSVFESFARSLIIDWINADATRARPALAAQELKDFFGKPVVDIEVIGDHGFDLTRSMGTVLFMGKCLDSLSVNRAVLDGLFSCERVREAMGRDLWTLNQRRHLFVHKRGIVDQEYRQRTGDKAKPGERLPITSDNVELSLLAVQKAIVALASAAEDRSNVVVT